MNNLSGVPAQQQGAESSTVKNRTFKTEAEAEKFYLNAMPMLLNVNAWSFLTQAVGGKYHLYCPQATPKTGHAEEGDFIRFTHTNANPQTGGGEVWYRIERIITKLHANDRSMAVVIRPTKVNISPARVTYSFNTEENHTLLLQLNQALVTAGVYTKNEEPVTTPAATEAPGVYTKIKHLLGNVFNRTGTPKNKWVVLVESFLK